MPVEYPVTNTLPLRSSQNISLENHGPDKDLPVIQLPDKGEQPDAAALRQEHGGRVRAAIDALPEPYRSTVLLSDVEGMSLAEIAEATESSVPAVKSRLHRARLRMRDALAPHFEGEVAT